MIPVTSGYVINHILNNSKLSQFLSESYLKEFVMKIMCNRKWTCYTSLYK